MAVTTRITRAGRRPPAPRTAPSRGAAAPRNRTRGPGGYWKQALTGIPVKLFAAVSGRRDLPLPSVLAHAAGERAARMAGSTAVVSALATPLRPITRQHYGPYLITTALVFATALRAVVTHWKRRQG